MDSKEQTKSGSVLYAAIPIAIDDFDLKRWYDVVESQKLNELAAIPPVYDRNSNPEEVYSAIASAHILLLLSGGNEQDYAKRFSQALTRLVQIDRPAVLIIQTTQNDAPIESIVEFDHKFLNVGLRGMRKGLEEIISGLKSGSVTPLNHFAPQLKVAIMAGPRSAANVRTKSRKIESESPNVQQENPNMARSGVGRVETSENPEEHEADDEGAATGLRFDQFRREEFSELAWQMLEVARRLGAGRERPPTSARRLLSAIVLSGLRRKGDDRTGSWLVSLIPQERDAIRSQILKRYPAAARHKGSFDAILRSDLSVSENMTEALKSILEMAKLLAAEARPGAPVVIGARHLLGAAVRQDGRETTVHRTLREFGLDIDDVRRQLIDQLPGWGLDDDQDAWRRVLELAAAVVDPERRLPTYAADSAVGPDLIGITREVEAMASLVSAWSVEPPLSIGLFGEWGSGKSFFMQKMKERVNQIAVEARKSNRAQRDFGYYKNIVQVEFNAWHYVEGNLWASLVEHIFTNLRFEGTKEENLDSEDNIRERLNKLMGLLRDRTAEANARDVEKLNSENAARHAEEKATQADTRAADAKSKADLVALESAAAMHTAVEKQASAQDTSEIRRSLLLKDVVEEIKLSPEVRVEVETGLDRLGINKDRLKTVQGVRDALREATEAGHVIAEGIVLLKQSQGWLLLFWAVAVPIVIVLIGLAFDGLASLTTANWVQRIGTTVSILSGLATGAVASWKKLSPRLQPFLDVVRKMKVERARIEASVEVERQNRAIEAAKLEQEVIQKQAEAETERRTAAEKAAEALKARQEAENRRAEADKAAKDAADARIAAEATAREADALRPERRIATFIQDRAAATDYRRHLGVPALIRRDFEKLSAMFSTQREAEEKGEDCGTANQRNDPTVVNRIILYIDDLDRCPPEKVVDVLRAIHLLLAFRLFVVVVAVDARWMKRALKDRFSLMLSAPETLSTNSARKSRANNSQEHIAWRGTASPDDYLEKIFQVPFWIRPLGRSGSRRLVTELTRHDVDLSLVSDAVPKLEASGNGNSGGTHEDKRVNTEDNTENKVGVSGGDIGSGEKQEAVPVGSASGKQKDDVAPSPKVSEWSAIEPKPRTLMLTPDERDYMVSLSPVIGRSPRSVKRFVNCYRLLKSTLDSTELDRATKSGTFRTSMLLLGIVTGFPEAAPALLADLRDASRSEDPEAWARAAAKRLQLEERRKWLDLLPVISRLRQWDVKTIAPLVDAAALVDRFSFSPVQRPVEELV